MFRRRAAFSLLALLKPTRKAFLLNACPKPSFASPCYSTGSKDDDSSNSVKNPNYILTKKKPAQQHDENSPSEKEPVSKDLDNAFDNGEHEHPAELENLDRQIEIEDETLHEQSSNEQAPDVHLLDEHLPDEPSSQVITKELLGTFIDSANETFKKLNLPIPKQTQVSKKQIPETYPEVVCVPVSRRPLIPGFYKTLVIKNKALASTCLALVKKAQPYLGVFLKKDEKEEAESEGQGNQERDESVDKISQLSQVYSVGSFVSIVNATQNYPPGSGLTLIVFPHRRIIARQLLKGSQESDPHSLVSIDNFIQEPFDKKDTVIKAITQEIFLVLSDIAKISPFFREHILHQNVSSNVFEDPYSLADFVGVLVSSEPVELQALLEAPTAEARLREALTLLKKELINAQLQQSISKDVEQKINQRQREHFLMEQLKAIKKELGMEADSKDKIIETFKARVSELTLPSNIAKAFQEELNKLSVLESSGSEFNIIRNYLDWMTQIPWGKYSVENFDHFTSAAILDEDHYGLEDVKERILEFIAVGKLRNSVQGKILCLVGPPGVGKTSVGKSIARALNRKYYRFSVGGLSDVAEIKGHRRTYVGAMPGKIVQALKNTSSSNPLILIDEVDKIGKTGYNGDPSSALLELLDPEQNHSFVDHYLDLPLDLSKVLFVCTANLTDPIPIPLLDRMEVIQLSGYVHEEKVQISKKYLIPLTRKESGLAQSHVQLTESVIDDLIKFYCRENGVRNLKKKFEKIFRKAALKLVKQGLLPAIEESSSGTENNGLNKEQSPNTSSNGSTNSSNKDSSSSSTSTNSTTDSNIPSTTPESVTSQTTVLLTSSDSTSSQTTTPDSTTISSTTTVESTIPLIVIDSSNLSEYIGNPHYNSERLYETTPPGVVMGLAWTSMGGSVLYIETLVERTWNKKEKSGLHRTGQLGKVMEESSLIAYTVSKSFLHDVIDSSNSFFENSTIHLHVPEGATPKDGPSAGITMATSLISLAINKPVRPLLAMTGELTLTGKILRIGGLKEKAIAAKRASVKHILFPKGNESDWKILPDYIKEGLDPHPVSDFQQVYKLCFDYDPKELENRPELSSEPEQQVNLK